jgi:membrane-associated protease RseP (regulator of RpoE activity)
MKSLLYLSAASLVALSAAGASATETISARGKKRIVVRMPKPPRPPDAPVPPAPPAMVHVRVPELEWELAGRSGGYLGVYLLQLNDALRDHFTGDEDAGVMVSGVSDDTPAAKAGVKVGDIIVSINGDAVKSPTGVARLIRKLKDGEEAKLVIVRAGKKKTLTATIVEKERPQVDVSKYFMYRFGDDDDDAVEVEIDRDALGERMREMREQLRHLEHGDVIKLEKLNRDLEERLQQLEKKLERLEKKLEGKRSANEGDRPA